MHKAKLTVLKVYQLAKLARADKCRLQTNALAERAIAQLSPPSTEKEVRRVIFYHLLHAATVNHINDAARDVRAVQRICKLHGLPHDWLHERIANANMHPMDCWMGFQDKLYGLDFSALAIDFDLSKVSDEDDYFLRTVALAEIVRIHDSYDDYQAKFRLPFPEPNSDPK